MIASTFNYESNILETEFNNDISSKDVIDYISNFKKNTAYPRKLKSIVIATDANFKFSFKDLKSFNDVKIESLKSYEIVMVAIIVSSPLTAALSTLYEAIANNKKYKFKVFSTREAAQFWLDSFRV
ncbi:hypothetical protein QLS71_005595 [Mariniflexile litorale]|uniref:SpoIIAA-like protein n=1 Tax=Mariniflexile litorale TaxID=3045158 RepID=A0AAU7EHC2_9FLAO|nr:hypothetical protein [Mariniflexile sp. KMM 9835]MDQ8211050.1 hypothetical protein [Mariniflexile sp. KMM 9835]